jgi:hypothetical protein
LMWSIDTGRLWWVTVLMNLRIPTTFIWSELNNLMLMLVYLNTG